MRSAWDDPRATYVGFKAGRNGVNHGHLDLGSFVMEALGVRWAVDPGADNYNLPGYFNNKSQRWTYYRMRAEGHNTLLVNPGPGPDQNIHAVTTIERFSDNPAQPFAIADLTGAYTPDAVKILRGVALEKGGGVLVQDEIKLNKPSDVWWLLHTRAEIRISDDGASAVLKQGADRLQVTLVSNLPVKFEMREAEPLPGSPHPPGQNANKEMRVLVLHFEKAQDFRAAVRLTPFEGESLPKVAGVVVPLAEWK
jgi:hypothetical protein